MRCRPWLRSVVLAGAMTIGGVPAHSQNCPIFGCTTQINTTSLPNATTGEPYSMQLTASGGGLGPLNCTDCTAGSIFSLSVGSLPAGFTLSSAGVLSSTGSPAASVNSYRFTVEVMAYGETATQPLTLVVVAAPASSPGTEIIGTVIWDGNPVPGVGVQVKTSSDFSGGALASAITGSDGSFLISNPPIGAFYIYAVGPSAQFQPWNNTTVLVTAGHVSNLLYLPIYKLVQLVGPASGVDASTTPTLQWVALPPTTNYVVTLSDLFSNSAVLMQSTTATQIAVSPPLSPGIYFWGVQAFDSSGPLKGLIGYNNWTFIIQSIAICTSSSTGAVVCVPTSIPNATSGQPYSLTFSPNGGSGGAVVWSYSGSLPPGFTFGQGCVGCSFVLTSTGSPAAPAGSYPFSVQAVDNLGDTATQQYTLVVTPAASMTPAILSGGVVNSASYAVVNGQGAPVAPGSLVSVFTSPLTAQAASATGISLPGSLGGVSLTFNGVMAPIAAVSPTGANPYINAQVPFDVLPAGQKSASVSVVLTVNNTASVSVQASIVPSAPGIFTIPPTGQGNAILAFFDPATNAAAIAAPSNAGIGYPTAPIPRGTSGFFYVTGLGGMTPPVADGSGTCTASNSLCMANATPQVLIGGVSAPVAFAGQAPGFPGVFQVNIMVPQNAPTGNSVSLVVKSADGTVTSNTATIAVQ